jgi:phage-related protein
VADESSNPKEAVIAWEGDSLGVMRRFPDEVKQNLGHQLRLLQRGERPTDYRPVATIGPGVFELRDQDERAWYRVIYLSRVRDVIHILHCFEKKSREIPQKDVQLAQQCLKAVRALIEEQRRHAKPGQ